MKKQHKHNYVYAYAVNKLRWKFCNLCGKVNPKDEDKYIRSLKRLGLNEFCFDVAEEFK